VINAPIVMLSYRNIIGRLPDSNSSLSFSVRPANTRSDVRRICWRTYLFASTELYQAYWISRK